MRWPSLLTPSKVCGLTGALTFAMCASALAHDPGLSSANIEIGAGAVEIQLTFNQRDIATVAGLSNEELRSRAGQERLENLARRAVVLRNDGEVQQPAASSASIDSNSNVEFRLAFPRLASSRNLVFESALLQGLSFGHRQAFTARDVEGREVSRRILSAGENIVAIPLRATTDTDQRGGFLEFLFLGIRHILTGYDHLLFLFGLLVVCPSTRSALLLITCFTLAHSLTLALSTFNLVNLPSRFVEAAIAASILYVGLENLFRSRGTLRGRWLLTFVFGLVHGLGFASVLREMGIAQSGAGAIVPLVSFNLGVEIGQMSVAAIVLPLIWHLRRRPGFLRVGVPACSALVAAAGAYWLFERTLLS